MTITIRILSIPMILIIVLNMIITIGVLYTARHSGGRLSQVMQFISYLIPGSCTVEINTRITLLVRLSNIGTAVSPILLPGGRSIHMLHSMHFFWVWPSNKPGLSISAVVGR